MSRFPKLSETFVLFEILALEGQRVRVEIYPLLRERPDVIHAESKPLVDRARYFPFLSWQILRSQLHYLVHERRRYVSTLAALVRGTWGSLNFFVGALGVFPKVAHAARCIAADGIDHVHCHFANHPAAAGFVIHRLTGIPYSFTAHGSDLHVDRHMLCQKLAEAKFVVAVSEFNRRVILEECDPRYGDKVTVLHCGIDTNVFRPPVSRPTGGPFEVVCVGTLHEVKGQTYLVEACRQLVEDGLDVVCRLVGDGPDRGRLERQIALAGLQGRVLLDGRRTREEIAALLRGADALAAPSVETKGGKREGIPVVLMEGLATGLPVVASAISGIPELVEHERTGLLVPQRDAAALGAALRRLHDAPELRTRLGNAGREKVVEEYNVDVSAAALAKLFGAGVRA